MILIVQQKMKKEIFRKLIHLSSIIYPILYIFFLSKKQMLFITCSIAVFLIMLDIIRKYCTPIKRISAKIFYYVCREKELEGAVLGSTYFMIGTFLTILFFSKKIAVASLFILIISDTAASLVGKAVPSRKLYQHKSLSGFIAFIISSIIISAFFNYFFIIPSIAVAFLELYAQKLRIDDNLLIPVSYGILAEITLKALSVLNF